MRHAPELRRLIAEERRRRRGPLLLAAAAAVVVSVAATVLLGLSGWFITGAALAGLAGLAAVQTFNYLLPSAMIRLLAILRTAFRYLERVSGHEAALKALAGLRPRLFRALAGAPAKEALALSGGEASARLVQDVDAIETLFVRLSAPWAAGAALIIGVALAGLAGPAPAVALAAFAILSAAAGRLLAERLTAAPGAARQVQIGELKDAAAAIAAAGPELRCYGLEGWAVDTLDRHGRALAETQVVGARAQATIQTAQSIITGLGVATIFLLAAPSALPLAALAGLAALVTLEAVAGAAKAFEQDGAVAEAGRRLEPLLAAPAAASGDRPDRPPSLELAGRRLAPGDRVLLAGPSGAGKTILIEQLLGLRGADPDGPRIAGQTPAALGPAFSRACFAWAPQDAALLAGTVRENLRLGAPGADDEVFWAALRDAALDQRVRDLPHGLDSWIGENGERLSGGERRRLSLARALLRPAPWLLLDEPTEGLDAWTEALVLKRLAKRLDQTGQGLIIVSHREVPCDLARRRVEVTPRAIAAIQATKA
ncbi:ABC transporter ATP-binding protein [Caulobacter mirabilis]|uniref:ABC transporter ATP-binding protein n=1 Tax=Caulobacter mirabilis TaxID=69666 RepID=A0A2D2B402_9CAUL|nr:ABC transporter ATP-binding protein [Caulobacter mirabilis]